MSASHVRFPAPPRAAPVVRPAAQAFANQSTSDYVGGAALIGLAALLYWYSTGPLKKYQAEEQRRLQLR